jgi:uncharacterized protein YndB with AHSA1/START domain
MSTQTITQETTQMPPVTTVQFERTYRATVQEIWDLWTTKEGFESWWGPEGFRVEVSRLEPRLGGALHYAMIADTPEMVAAMKQMGQPAVHDTRGRFSEFAPHRRIGLTHMIDFFKGVEPFENTMEVDLTPQGEWVRMVVTLHPMANAELSRMQAQGFGSQLGKLDKRFQQS